MRRWLQSGGEIKKENEVTIVRSKKNENIDKKNESRKNERPGKNSLHIERNKQQKGEIVSEAKEIEMPKKKVTRVSQLKVKESDTRENKKRYVESIPTKKHQTQVEKLAEKFESIVRKEK